MFFNRLHISRTILPTRFDAKDFVEYCASFLSSGRLSLYSAIICFFVLYPSSFFGGPRQSEKCPICPINVRYLRFGSKSQMSYTFPKNIVSPPLITKSAQYPFLDKFIEVASGCSGLDTCVFSIFTTRNLPLDFQ